jgi:ABC-type sugar transport system ATPase subunit
MSGEPFVALRDVTKRYGPVTAIAGVDLELRTGEVHCLAGENGAGKSTLIKVLTGAVRRDGGEYRVQGRDVGHPTPAQARDLGVGVVYQELSLLPDLSVEENLVMGRFPARGGFVRRADVRAHAREALERVGLGALDPRRAVAELPPGTRQRVEIAKVLGQGSRLVILDEPTTALAEAEAAALLELVGRLRDEGVGVLYITHRLEEMFAIGDRLTVLRDGRVTRTGAMAEFDEDSLIAAMVGRQIEALYPSRTPRIGRPLLAVRGLRTKGNPHAVDLTVHAGEILGVAGLLGSGRTELLRAIFGADPVDAGEVEVDGRRVPPGQPRRAVRAGLGLLSEDRKELGLLLELSIRENASIANMPEIASFGLLNRRREASAVDRLLGGLRLRAASYDQPVSALSGGNQQKVLLARWLATKAKVLLFDEPTKGVDVGAKAEIYEVIGDLADQGLGVVVVSSYLPELLGLCDRLVVLREGGMTGELAARGATEEDVLRLASAEAPREEQHVAS